MPEIKPARLRDFVIDVQRRALRKVKTLSDDVKAIVYGGNLQGPEMAVQFNRDVRLYGMWEALLYVEQYEKQNGYKPGTAEQAAKQAIAALQLQ